MLFTVAFGRGGSVPALRKGLERYAEASGGRAYFAEDVRDLGRVFGEIVENLANQYMLSYTPPHPERDGRWHALEVRVRGGRYEVRAREGYRAAARRGRGGER
jgi:VWFA-related protein